LGLVGLRERVEALQGRLELTGTPGEGVHVTAWLPLMGRG
jgi:signal transduction histidine kinase